MTSMLKSDKWSEGNRSNIEGSNIAVLTSQFELSQIIKKPTVILEYSSSCIDLVSTTNKLWQALTVLQKIPYLSK